MAARILILLLFSIRLSAQSDTDTFMVEGKDFKGYIMPLDAKAQHRSFNFENQFLPDLKDIGLAEKILSESLEKKCAIPKNYFDSVDCKVISESLPDYFRQYAAFIDKETRHRVVYILLISKNAQTRISYMKKTWMNGTCDGGPLFFHVYIDIDAGKCTAFKDNGRG